MLSSFQLLLCWSTSTFSFLYLNPFMWWWLLLLFQLFFWLWKCFPIFSPPGASCVGKLLDLLSSKDWEVSLGCHWFGWESPRYGESKEDMPGYGNIHSTWFSMGKTHIHKSGILNSNVYSRQATLNRSPSVLLGRPLHLEPILSHDLDLDPVFFLVVPVICYSLPWTMAQYGWCLNDLALNNGDFP